MAQDVPSGSPSRKPRSSGKMPFSQAKLESGAQRSHVIPQDTYLKKFPDLFQLISKAKLPDGQLPFDPENYRQNGQALPSDTSGANGKAVFDLFQHIRAHPHRNGTRL